MGDTSTVTIEVEAAEAEAIRIEEDNEDLRKAPAVSEEGPDECRG